MVMDIGCDISILGLVQWVVSEGFHSMQLDCISGYKLNHLVVNI